jgi:hypothetical protein
MFVHHLNLRDPVPNRSEALAIRDIVDQEDPLSATEI